MMFICRCLSVGLYVGLSVCQSVCLSIYPSVCLYQIQPCQCNIELLILLHIKGQIREGQVKVIARDRGRPKPEQEVFIQQKITWRRRFIYMYFFILS